jgi:nicotinate-nucleotide adenylyltransferase
MRLGIFGGTFDPVHFGHLLLAEVCREKLSLDRVWFLPAAIPPHKKTAAISEDRHRVEMLSLAIAGNAAFALCLHEIERGGVNYTVETLAFLKEQDPRRELFFLMGGDSLADLPNWKEPARICELATIVVVNRPDMAELRFDLLAAHLPSAAIERIRQHVVEMPRIDLSSREIRQQVAAGKSIRYRTPRAVELYIETHGLYRSGGLTA